MSLAAALPALVLAAAPARAAAMAELRESWGDYRRAYVSEDGRVIDFRADSSTTSEGQAYAMVRALWMGDRPSFDLVRAWTVNNLQAGDPSRLPAWKWGRQPDDTWSVLDAEPAADADQLYAWALLGAAKKWRLPPMKAQALQLLARIWDEEVSTVGGRLVLLPGPWARDGAPTRVNPSYFLPFVWRDFARADRAHPWMHLLDEGYRILSECRSPSGLPRDWCDVDSSGRVVESVEPARGDFGFEAFRVGWTLAAEVRWHHEARAKALLPPFAELYDRMSQPGRLPAVIRADGSAGVDWEYPGMYGALLPAWALTRPGAAEAVWTEVLTPLRTETGWGDPVDYYGQNWIWFGLALWQLKEMPA